MANSGVGIVFPVRMTSLAAALTAGVLMMSSAAAASAAPPKCADLDGTVGPDQTCQISVDDPNYTMDISFPAGYPDAKGLIDYVRQTRDGYLAMAKGGGGRNAPYALEIKSTAYSSAVPPRGTQSVVLETYESIGGPHPQNFYKTFNWDQGFRKPITIDTLWAKGSEPYPVLYPLVSAELDKQLGVPGLMSQAAGLDPASYQNFAITNDSLIFFFGRGEVLPEPAGAVAVTVPRGPVDAMIA